MEPELWSRGAHGPCFPGITGSMAGARIWFSNQSIVSLFKLIEMERKLAFMSSVSNLNTLNSPKCSLSLGLRPTLIRRLPHCFCSPHFLPWKCLRVFSASLSVAHPHLLPKSQNQSFSRPSASVRATARHDPLRWTSARETEWSRPWPAADTPGHPGR